MDAIEEKHFERAEDFLDYLQIRHERWLPDGAYSSPWVFRGHADARWKLIPSAWRRAAEGEEKSEAELIVERARQECERHELVMNEIHEYQSSIRGYQKSGWEPGGLIYRGRKIAADIQAIVEFKLVSDFVHLADELGLTLPDGTIVTITMDKFIESQFRSSGYFDSMSLTEKRRVRDFQYALAQHHGVPTRYLDWTSSALVAAFFAADDAVKENSSQLMAVWAINRQVCKQYLLNLEFVICPRSELKYLYAQKGLFTLDEQAWSHYVDQNVWQSLEEIVLSTSCPETVLRKLTLPTSQARTLLRLLWVEGITRAHLMPGYDNVAATLKTKWL